MTEKFSPFDSADYLKTEADIVAYVEAASLEGGDDPVYMAHVMATVARARNMSQLARDAHLSREGLRKALAPGANPSYATVAKVARALGFAVTFTPLARTALAGQAVQKVALTKAAKDPGGAKRAKVVGAAKAPAAGKAAGAPAKRAAAEGEGPLRPLRPAR